MDKPGPWKWITRPVSVNLSVSISVTLGKGDSSVPSLGLQRRLSELVDILSALKVAQHIINA